MRRVVALSIGATVMLNFAVSAETTTKNVMAGRTVRIWSVFSCDFHDFDVWPVGAQHGTVTTQKYKASKCYKQDVPHVGVLYTSAPGYKGFDQVWIQSSGGSRTQVRIYVQ